MSGIQNTAVLGGGVIGASWTALFLAAGKSVTVYDPEPRVESSARRFIENAWPALMELGLAHQGNPDALRFSSCAAEAVDGAEFIQESVPERIEIKHAVFREIGPALGGESVVASSASGLTLTEMQRCWKNPGRLVLGHPFNPPHLIPLVEVMGNERTEPGVVDRAEAFYREVGKVTIRVNREVPGHVANRLQAALWREAIHLVQTGVASVSDVDTAIQAGPGLRWAAMGPTMLFRLAAGSGGMHEFCNRYADSFNRWWADLGSPRMDESTAKLLTDGVEEEAGGKSIEQHASERDALIVAMLKATRNLRK